MGWTIVSMRITWYISNRWRRRECSSDASFLFGRQHEYLLGSRSVIRVIADWLENPDQATLWMRCVAVLVGQINIADWAWLSAGRWPFFAFLLRGSSSDPAVIQTTTTARSEVIRLTYPISNPQTRNSKYHSRIITYTLHDRLHLDMLQTCHIRAELKFAYVVENRRFKTDNWSSNKFKQSRISTGSKSWPHVAVFQCSHKKSANVYSLPNRYGYLTVVYRRDVFSRSWSDRKWRIMTGLGLAVSKRQGSTICNTTYKTCSGESEKGLRLNSSHMRNSGSGCALVTVTWKRKLS